MVDDPLLGNISILHPLFRIGISSILAGCKRDIRDLKFLDLGDRSRYPADPEGMLSKELECFRGIEFRIRDVVDLFMRL